MYGMLPPLPTQTRYPFAGDVQNIQRGMSPRIMGRSYAIEAEVTVPAGGAEGVLVANSDFIGGYALWVDNKGLLNHTYSFLGVETYKQTSTVPIPTGDVTFEDAFPGRRAEARAPGATSRCGRTISRSERARSQRRCRSGSRATPAWTSDATTAVVVDLAYEDKAPYALHRHGQEGRLRPQARRARGPPGTPRGGAPGRRGPCGQCVSERRERDRTRQRHEKGVVTWLGLTLPGRGFDNPATEVNRHEGS